MIPNVSCIMIRFLLAISFLFLSGCSNDCIQPTDLGVSKQSISLSTKQKEWVAMEIVGNITELDITPRNLNFCKDSNHVDEYIDDQSRIIQLPFNLESGDKISFSVIPNKICINDKKEERFVSIDDHCNEKEKEYFAKILNKDGCEDHSSLKVCPNKYVPNNEKWLNGAEYISLDKDTGELRNKIEKDVNNLKERQCHEFKNITFKGMDTYILNLLRKEKCNDSNHVYSESIIETEDTKKIREYINENFKESKVKNLKNNLIKENDSLKTYIPLLKVSMDGENFLHSQGGIITNYENVVEKNHLIKEENLNFAFSSLGKGGYNIRIKRHVNINLKNILYIHTGNNIPNHKPGEGSSSIPVDINKIHDDEYMTSIVKDTKGKSKIYFGIRDHGCDYNNEGEFDIRVTMRKPPIKNISVIYDFMNRSVNEAFFGSNYRSNSSTIDFNYQSGSPTRTIYESFIRSDKTSSIRSTIIALLILSIILYTLYYFFGLSHASVYEFLIMCVKIGVIAQLLQDNSWNFFYENVFSLFINAPKQLIGIANLQDVSNSNSVFEFLDLPLNRFLSSHSVLLIISLIFSGPLGIISFCLLIWGIIVTCSSTFNALFTMVTSIAVIALLLSLSPIFIICLLFSYTRKMFTTWINYLGRFAIVPVIMMIFISLIGRAMDYIIYSVFNFTVCSKCILNLNLGILVPSINSNIPICVFHMYAAEHAPNITSIIALIILGHSMKAVIGASARMSDTLFNTHVFNEPDKSYREHLQAFTGLNTGQQQSTPSIPRTKMIRQQGSK